MLRFLKYLFLGLLSVLFLLVLVDRLTPKLKLAFIKPLFDKGGVQANAGLEEFVPIGIVSIKDIPYKEKDTDAFLDIFYPEHQVKNDEKLPIVIWIHGGGWVAGAKSDVQNYCKMIAHKGFMVVAVEYTLAPKGIYPKPVQQVMDAIYFLNQKAEEYPGNTENIFLAGDSAGAQIAAQVAAIGSDPSYAGQVNVEPSFKREHLSGVVLYCGFLNVPRLDGTWFFKWLTEAFLWSYGGSKDYENDPYFQTVNVINALNENFPPTFLSVGNIDPIRSHSYKFAKQLDSLEVPVKTLFFEDDYPVNLTHEYQFDWKLDEARLAFDQMIDFLFNLAFTKNNESVD